MRPIPLFIIALLVVTVAQFVAQERVARWWAEPTDRGAVATDCENCGDDVGVMLECDKGKNRARLSLMWGAQGSGDEGDIVDVALDVDGVSETRKVRLQYQGTLGQVPIIDMALDDPLMARLAGGTTFSFRTPEGANEVSLRGSARALETIRQACR